MAASPNHNCFLDSNILLRLEGGSVPHNPVSASVSILLRRGTHLFYTSQTLAEFWNVATRPAANNGFGLHVSKVNKQVRSIERRFTFLPDTEAVHYRWLALLMEHEIKGVQVYDARIAAAMYVYGLNQILTLNGRDFQRFPGIRILDPAGIASG